MNKLGKQKQKTRAIKLNSNCLKQVMQHYLMDNLTLSFPWACLLAELVYGVYADVMPLPSSLGTCRAFLVVRIFNK